MTLGPTKPRILLVAYGGGHATMLVPLYQLMAAQATFDLTFLALTTGAAVLERAGIPYLGFKDLVTLPQDEAALAAGRELAESVPGGQLKSGLEETVAYLGLSYQDLAGRLGEAAARRAYEKDGRRAFLPLGVLGRLFDRLQPDLVITTNSPRAEKAAILTARERGVAAICLVDLFGEPDVEYVGRAGYADRVCVLSEITRDFLVKAGRQPAEIVVTGNPAFDRWADPALPARAQELRSRMGWQGRKVLLWASQPEPAPNIGLPRSVDAELFRVLARHPEWQLVIRPHPSETVSYDSLPANIVISAAGDDLSALVAASDLVITFNSTLGLEGVMIGKPLVTVDLSVQCQYLPYSKMGLATGVSRLPDLEAGIVLALAAGPQKGAAIPAPGSAAARVMQVAQDLLAARGGWG